MTAFSLGAVSGRFWATRKTSSSFGKRFRGKKAAVEAIQRKKQNIDATMVRLLAEVAEVHSRWGLLQGDRSHHETDKLVSVVARAQIMHCALAKSVATVEQLSVFGLNACDADLEAAISLLSRLRMEVRASAARAVVDSEGTPTFMYQGCKLSA